MRKVGERLSPCAQRSIPTGEPQTPAVTVQHGGKTVKLRMYKVGFALASIAVFIEVLGAGRRF
jgi:hypothetical protein